MLHVSHVARIAPGNCVDSLLHALRQRGYMCIGPTLRDAAVVYDEIRSERDLPIGWADEQEGGSYRLKKRNDEARFGYTAGPQSWKRYLFPPSTLLMKAKRTPDGFTAEAPGEKATPHAFLGVRSCDLNAIAVQDRTFLTGPYVDPTYKARREAAFIVVVHCGQAARTCFCVSMETGPMAKAGYDLALTEILEDGRHEFLVEVGSPRGAEVAGELPSQAATESDARAARRMVDRAVAQMGRAMDTTDLKELLYRALDHPRWGNVAARCLSCANCTLVCPTCFCSTVEEVTDLTGDHAERRRRWDSCFTAAHSYIHGGSVRPTTLSRYRQWMTHKLATWIDQFGTSGCVGCGRCITWCPVGIDITEEVRAIREDNRGKGH
ncbi:MAG: 4Fe-4S dicluster domain-containing protein [Planctomycetes bacterium]|nr:4Fe-4S dicluster domain-containing protein [Planctomycetota bacterium]